MNVNHSNKISNRKIIIPNIKNAINSYDRERYWFGESYSEDNSGNKSAKYGKKYVFYSKGLDKQAIKNIFNLSQAKVSWTTNNGESKEKVFKLSEIITFK